MAKVGRQLVNALPTQSRAFADFFERDSDEQIGTHEVKRDRGAQPASLDRGGVRDPDEEAADDFQRERPRLNTRVNGFGKKRLVCVVFHRWFRVHRHLTPPVFLNRPCGRSGSLSYSRSMLNLSGTLIHQSMPVR